MDGIGRGALTLLQRGQRGERPERMILVRVARMAVPVVMPMVVMVPTWSMPV